MQAEQAERIECGRCSRQLDRMVVMNCSHHMCLECAAKSFSMRKARNQTRYRIQCEVCQDTTVVEESAAHCLLGQLEDLTKKSMRQTKTSKHRNAVSPGLSHRAARDLLYCKDCEQPLGDVDEYLRSAHRQHTVQNIKNMEMLQPILECTLRSQSEIRETLEERIGSLTTKQKEKESILGFLAEKKQIERSKVQMIFDKLRKAVEERELHAYRQLEQLFSEEVACLQKWLGKATEQLFKADLKLNQINELVRDKALQQLFAVIKDRQKVVSTTQFIANLEIEEEHIVQLNRLLEANLTSFRSFMRATDRYRETLPSYSPTLSVVNLQEITIRDINNLSQTPEKGTTRQQEPTTNTKLRPNLGSLNSPLNSNRPDPEFFKTELKNVRSNSSLGPSLLKLNLSTPMDSLIRNLEHKICRKSQRLQFNLFSPRNVQPIDRIRRLFSPT